MMRGHYIWEEMMTEGQGHSRAALGLKEGMGHMGIWA
jgi:hypothetical protein